MAAILLTCMVLASVASASEFLKGKPKELHESLSEEEIRTSLLEEIESTLGAGSASGRLAQIEASLQPIFTALQKNEYGNLGHATVRYALHRLFVLRHGWNIKGLGANGEHWNSSSPTGVLKDQVPEYIEELFEKRLGGRGFGLRELAVLGSTIEHLIHTETVSKLGDVFNVLNHLPTSKLSQYEGHQVLDTYMMSYILAENLANLTYNEVMDLNQEMPTLFLAWGDTQQFVRDIWKRVVGGNEEVDFTALARIAEVVGEEFGTFQDAECRSLKKSLMDMEDRSSGRVKLSDFYKPAMNGAWQFQESVAYLRQLGALDETAATPSVIITNYLYSQANCIASSGYYAVCCKDECEGLLGHLEDKLAAPEASASVIANIIETLPSSTVSLPRTISSTLRTRLDDIALHHGGQVPLHGRLFAQWMHHAYPHECPFPHISGTTSQQSSDEWSTETGSEATATEEEMAQFTNATDSRYEWENQEEITEWSHEEELLVSRPTTVLRTDLSTLPPLLRSAMLIIAAVSLAFGMVQSLKTTLSTNVEDAKFVV